MLRLIVILILATSGVTIFADAVISQPTACNSLMSNVWRGELAAMLGAEVSPDARAADPPSDSKGADASAASPGPPLIIPLPRLFAGVSIVIVVAWLLGSVLLWRIRGDRLGTALVDWGCWGGLWGIACGLWWIGWLTLTLTGWLSAAEVWEFLADLFIAAVLAGAFATWTVLLWRIRRELPPTSSSEMSRWPAIGVVAAMLVYTAVYFTLNARLYQNLLIPHGDTAMYEEHLWNLEHGKGFRSYLDPGLFLGEHIQVVHVLLVPLHLVWPSHLALELCQSAALAAAAWPVFLIARRHTGSDRIGLLLAIAYLCYAPMQYLDIAIDLKTFRPTAFGIAPMLMAIDAMERRRYRSMSLWLLLALSCQEDFAIPIGCLGAWLCMTSAIQWWRTRRTSHRDAGDVRDQQFRATWVGAAVWALSIVYLLIAIKWVIPGFRGEEVPHYTRYFEGFGDTPGEIVWTMITRPNLVLDEMFSREMLIYGLHLLVPLGLASLLAPVRLIVALPLWMLLCMNALARDPYLPVHHFHAPLIPILVWTAIAGVGNIARIVAWVQRRRGSMSSTSKGLATTVFATFVLACSVATELFDGVGPQSLKFWDAGSFFHWRELYVISERARQFEKVAAQIPQSARVASTDFVHPRFTHCERSYDYSGYVRSVADNTTNVPDDTEYIVIDTGHRYSWIHSPDEVRELQEEPDKWELLPDETDGNFILLRRR